MFAPLLLMARLFADPLIFTWLSAGQIRNVEARVIANVINAVRRNSLFSLLPLLPCPIAPPHLAAFAPCSQILDKFSIDGVLRLGRLPVPNAARWVGGW